MDNENVFEQKPNKKAILKNILIVFIIVMIVLTFFSNTIMNASLPEVSASYVKDGTITERVRGSGVAQSNSSYKVTLGEAREISEIKIKAGDTVKEGDVLFTLKPKADKTDENELSYQTAYFTALNDFAVGGNTSEAKPKLEKAKQQMKEEIYKAKGIDDKSSISTKTAAFNVWSAQLETQITNISSEKYDGLPTARKTALENAKKAAEDATKAVEDAQKALEEANEKLESPSKTIEKSIEEQQKAVDEAYKAYCDAADAVNNYVPPANPPAQTDLGEDGEEIPGGMGEADQSKELAQAYEQAGQTYNAAVETLNGLNNSLNEAYNIESQINNAKSDLEIKTNNSKDKTEAYSKKQEEITHDITVDKDVVALLIADLTKEQSKADDKTSQIIGDEVIAKYSGVVSVVNVSVGDTTSEDMELANIVLSEKGYKVSVSVTKAQAKKVKIGDKAEVVNDSGATATLESIKANKEGGADSRLLVFLVSGEEIEDGVTVNISMECSSAKFDYIVPKSAVMEDSNGKFVLEITSQSTPLGNRYYATKREVKVIVTDDTSAAVSGDISKDSYVITAAEKDVEAGSQVRLHDKTDKTDSK